MAPLASPPSEPSTFEPSARSEARAAILLSLLLALLSGAVPILLSLLSGLIFPYQSTGSILIEGGRAVGSELVGQPYEGDHYFHGRPSAIAHDPMALAGSNLAPSNPALRERVLADAQRIAAREGVSPREVPLDLLAASGSGIDPHISPAAAKIQVARVARARGVPASEIEAAIARHTAGKTLGLLGEARVHVLRLNLDLDQHHKVAVP